MSAASISDAFARYGATLKNPNWSVSAWAPDGSLVVSMWQHHYRKGPAGSIEFADSASRWRGPGNNEFRANIAAALTGGKRLRLVIVRTEDPAYVQSGKDASKIKKTFHIRDDFIGEVTEFDGDRYVVRFVQVAERQ